MNSTLRLRWAWNARPPNNRAWSILLNPLKNHERRLLNAAAHVELGNGNRCFFWTDKWINGVTVEDIAPEVFKSVPPVVRERRTVAKAMISAVWIKDIKGKINIRIFHQILTLWEVISEVQIIQGAEDKGHGILKVPLLKQAFARFIYKATTTTSTRPNDTRW